MILKLCLSRALEFLGNTDLLLRTYSYFGCPWHIKCQHSSRTPWVLFQESWAQKTKKKNEKNLKLTLVIFWKSRRDTSALMIMISLLDTWRKRGYRKNCQLVHSQDNWASASLLHFRHFTVYSSPVDTLLKCCWHSIQKYGQQLNPN